MRLRPSSEGNPAQRFHRSRGFRLLRAVAALAAIATGCGGSSKPSSSHTTTPSATTATSATTSTTAAPPNLQAELLTVSDLPTGWSVDNSPSNTSTDTTPACLKDASKLPEATSKAEVSFKKGTGVPIFSQKLAYFAASGGAQAQFNQADAILGKCKDISFQSDGQTYKGSIGALSFPKYEDGSSAYTVEVSTHGFVFGLYVLYVWKGSRLMLLTYADLGTPSVEEFKSFADKAYAKLP